MRTEVVEKRKAKARDRTRDFIALLLTLVMDERDRRLRREGKDATSVRVREKGTKDG